MISKKRYLRYVPVLLVTLMMISALRGMVVQGGYDYQDGELRRKLEQEAIALLTKQFQLEYVVHTIAIQDVAIESASARVDVRLDTVSDGLGTVSDLMYVFAIHDGSTAIHVFREPSPDFYLYADKVSPDLLPAERLEFWKQLMAEEQNEERLSARSAQDSSSYKLPWTGGRRYGVYQDYNKHFDFQLPVGTQVRAAKGGEVYVKRASADGGCCDMSCDVYNNYVRILHADGTYGFYLHLKFGSITVNTGDSVAQGDCLARSGNT